MLRRSEFLDECAQGIGPGQPWNLVAKFEVVENVLDVGRKAVEVGSEVGRELLAVGAGPQVAQGELRGVVEGLSRSLPQRRILLDDTHRIKRGFHIQHGLFAVLQDRIQPAQHGYRKNDVAVFTANVEVAQDVVGDTPDVVGNPVQIVAVHWKLRIYQIPWNPRMAGVYRRDGPGSCHGDSDLDAAFSLLSEGRQSLVPCG